MRKVVEMTTGTLYYEAVINEKIYTISEKYYTNPSCTDWEVYDEDENVVKDEAVRSELVELVEGIFPRRWFSFFD